MRARCLMPDFAPNRCRHQLIGDAAMTDAVRRTCGTVAQTTLEQHRTRHLIGGESFCGRSRCRDQSRSCGRKWISVLCRHAQALFVIDFSQGRQCSPKRVASIDGESSAPTCWSITRNFPGALASSVRIACSLRGDAGVSRNGEIADTIAARSASGVRSRSSRALEITLIPKRLRSTSCSALASTARCASAQSWPMRGLVCSRTVSVNSSNCSRSQRPISTVRRGSLSLVNVAALRRGIRRACIRVRSTGRLSISIRSSASTISTAFTGTDHRFTNSFY